MTFGLISCSIYNSVLYLDWAARKMSSCFVGGIDCAWPYLFGNATFESVTYGTCFLKQK